MNECESCGGCGALIVLSKPADGPDRYEVQRCDTCKRFRDDRSAWRKLQPANTQGRRS